jgi:uncharacterized protein with HEPN domain
MRDVFELLRDIQEAIAQITKYTYLGRQSFDQDELIRIWVIHHLEIISEATRSIPQEYKNYHPEVPWNQISRMRNVLIHIYFGIDLDIIWEVVERDLPVLKASVDAILAVQEGTSSERQHS